MNINPQKYKCLHCMHYKQQTSTRVTCKTVFSEMYVLDKYSHQSVVKKKVVISVTLLN